MRERRKDYESVPVCGGMNMISLNEARRWKRKNGTDVKKVEVRRNNKWYSLIKEINPISMEKQGK